MISMRAGFLGGLVLAVALAGMALVASRAAGADTTYYVDCDAGDDSASGTGTGTAWRSLDRAGQESLGPGDTLRLKRGCTWSNERLDAGWSGTATAPILVASYDIGARPRIVGDTERNSAVRVTGTHLIIRGLDVSFVPVDFDPCGQPLGTYYGVNLTDGASFNTLENSAISASTAGVHLAANSSDNIIRDNEMSGNNVMSVWGGNPALDLGAWGVLLRSDRNEISGNVFRDNKAVCVNALGRLHSNSVEIFEGRENSIHHNKSFGDRVFSELGGSAAERAADNWFAFNVHSSDAEDARFITTRGALATDFGPVERTIAERNTIHLTGSGSVGVSCGQGCSAEILTLTSNIIWAEDKPVFADGLFNEAGNVYWSSDGGARLQIETIDSIFAAGAPVLNGSIVADPGFVNPANENFRTNAVEVVDRGVTTAGHSTDAGGDPPALGSAPDAGAYEQG